MSRLWKAQYFSNLYQIHFQHQKIKFKPLTSHFPSSFGKLTAMNHDDDDDDDDGDDDDVIYR